jgi:hypothetical protein
MGANTARAKMALEAMKQLGISRKQATPVLKQLLKTFNNNWELIEDECYRALADAILDAQDNKQTPDTSQVSFLRNCIISSCLPYQLTVCTFSVFYIRGCKQPMRTRILMAQQGMIGTAMILQAKMIMKPP